MSPVKSTEEHQELIKQFRKRLNDVIREDDTDAFLLKWLKARLYKLDDAEKMFRDSRIYKDKINIKKIREKYEPPEVLRKYFPGGLTGYDKEGSPLKIERFGYLDMRGIMHSTRMSDLEKTRIQMCERTVDMWKEESERRGEPVDGLMVIMDLENLGMKSLWRPGMQMFIHLADLLELNYPEMMKVLFVINAPAIFPLLWKISRPLVPDEMKKKIHVLGGDYKTQLLKLVDQDQLPMYLGGTKVDPVDGGEFCTSLICPGGEVPKSYYLKENPAFMSTFEKKEIGKGSEFVMEFDVELAGSVLKWEFRLEDHDIGFSVSRKTFGTTKSKKDETVVKAKRVACNILAEEGSIICDQPATYKIRFDNSYSWTRGKTLHYLIELYTADETTEQDLDSMVGEETGSWTRFVDNKQITHL